VDFGYEWKDDRTMISIEDCKKGYLYLINSRNLDLAVYDGDGGFIGIREKFGQRFLFTEFHWDTGEPYGTVRPQEELEHCPIESISEGKFSEKDYTQNQELFAYLDHYDQIDLNEKRRVELEAAIDDFKKERE
jgi:hypothetical protein